MTQIHRPRTSKASLGKIEREVDAGSHMAYDQLTSHCYASNRHERHERLIQGDCSHIPISSHADLED